MTIGFNSISVLNDPNSKSSLFLTFLQQYVNPNFIEDIINVVIYQTDLDNFIEKVNTNSLDKIDTFLKETYKFLDKNKKITSIGNFPVNTIKFYFKFAKTVINIKKTVGNSLLTYDSLFEHFSQSSLTITNLIKKISDNRLINIDDFKQKLNDVLSKISFAEQIFNIKNSLIELDNIRNDIETDTNLNTVSLLVKYKETVDFAAEELNKLKNINIKESLSNSIMVGGIEYNCENIANNLVKYLSSGYAFYKSGYDIIDESIGGIEAANFHLICGPSNNAKSIFMINLLRTMALNNKREFNKDTDLILYITLED